MKKWFVIILLLLSIWSCFRSKFNDPVLKYISKQYPLLEFNAPVLIDTLRNDIYNNRGEGAISNYYTDTLKSGKIASTCVFKAVDGVSYLYYYTQIWKENDWKYELKIAKDTLYSFRSRRTDIEFLVGEYEFRRWGGTRQHHRLDSQEIIYYDLHHDSLRKVKGNNLPPLPNPTEEERKQWLRMQKKK